MCLFHLKFSEFQAIVFDRFDTEIGKRVKEFDLDTFSNLMALISEYNE